MKKHLVVFCVLAAMIAGTTTHAAQGGDRGNGGDICEKRFSNVRDDLQLWIQQGGSAGLQLPTPITFGEYNQKMLQSIAIAKISCTDDKILIGQAEKTCRNYVANDGTVLINCNITRFMNTSESDQYVLVHHEYAGLSGFEVNTDESSDYRISNQISGYLENEVVKKLKVKPTTNPITNPFDPNSCVGLPMTEAEAISHIAPGNFLSPPVAQVKMAARYRVCQEKTGCSDWSSDASRIAGGGYGAAFGVGFSGPPQPHDSCCFGSSTAYGDFLSSGNVNRSTFRVGLDGKVVITLGQDYPSSVTAPYTTPVYRLTESILNYQGLLSIPSHWTATSESKDGYLVLGLMNPKWNVSFDGFETNNKDFLVSLTGILTNHCLRLSTANRIAHDEGVWIENEGVAYSTF